MKFFRDNVSHGENYLFSSNSVKVIVACVFKNGKSSWVVIPPRYVHFKQSYKETKLRPLISVHLLCTSVAKGGGGSSTVNTTFGSSVGRMYFCGGPETEDWRAAPGDIRSSYASAAGVTKKIFFLILLRHMRGWLVKKLDTWPGGLGFSPI